MRLGAGWVWRRRSRAIGLALRTSGLWPIVRLRTSAAIRRRLARKRERLLQPALGGFLRVRLTVPRGQRQLVFGNGLVAFLLHIQNPPQINVRPRQQARV